MSIPAPPETEFSPFQDRPRGDSINQSRSSVTTMRVVTIDTTLPVALFVESLRVIAGPRSPPTGGLPARICL